MKTFATVILLCCFYTHSAAQDGTLEERSFVNNDSLRNYLLYVPVNYDGQDAWPLVINFHGFRTDATFQIDFSQMNAAADSMNFLVAYPQGLIVTGMLGPGSGWAIPNVQSENDDVSFSNELIDLVAAEYNVDMNRIHTTGWSQGSSMAYYLACSLPDRIASVAGVAGHMPFLVQDNCEPGRPISTMHFHGTLDPILPFEGIPDVWPPVPSTPSFWAVNNNCAPDSMVTELEDISTADSTTVTRIEYTDCDDDTEVVFYRINDGGHPWPGSTPVPGLEFLGHTNQDINATAEILAFFSRNPMPEAPGGVLEERSFMQGDSLRSYLLHIPSSYDGASEWPLVLNYHGYNINGAFQLAIDQMDIAAETSQFLIAYPQGLLVDNPLDGTTGPGWNLTGTFSENDDLAFTDQIIDHIKEDYLVNDSRIHATGWSMGSEMAFQVACSSDQIASVAGVSGQMTEAQLADCNVGRPMSALIMHGTADPLVPFDGLDLGENAIGSVVETVSFWAEHNGCSTDSTVTDLEDSVAEDNSTVTLVEYSGCNDGSEVQFYRVNDGGHTWPGGSFPGGAWPGFLGHVNQDLNASDEILAFFSRNPIKVATSTEDDYLPSEISLYVYPNPFSERFTIEFDVPSVNRVQLALYNVLGQKLQTIVDRTVSTGIQRIEWRTSEMNLPSGMYFLRLQVGEKLLTRPISRIAR